MKWTFLLILAWLCTSCAIQNSQPSTPQMEVIAAVESTEDPTIPIPECAPASGATFRLQKISDNRVELIATGLQPGETPRVFYNSTYNGKNAGSSGIFDANVVPENGEFYNELSRLDSPEEKAAMTWDIRLQHRLGVECASITLP